MPVINPKENSSNAQRSTFRPPWVKDGPNPLPMPTAPWAGRTSNANAANSEDRSGKPEKPTLRKQTKVTIPIEPANNQNSQPTTNQRQEKVIPIKVITENSKPLQKDNHRPSLSETQQQSVSWRKDRGQQQPQPVTKPPVRPSTDRPMPPTAQKPPPPPAMSANAVPPPPPPMMGPPPPPPPMNDSKPPVPLDKKPLTKEKAAKIEALRSRPRRRPDWSDMMKEVESGKKLKHVQCNDRSAPVLPQMKAKGQFVYDSENKAEDNSHNKLLKQIQSGVKLRKVKVNDRSKPNLDGLRKFRRQMTIEEQLQKSVSMADVVAAAVQPDELDDIDKVRDDLQSAKQMLALELRNKEAMERENKRLMARLANLEAELEKEKSSRNEDSGKGRPVRTDDDEKLIIRLKEEAIEAERTAKDMETKYHTTAEQLDNTRRKLESAWLRNQELEQQLKSVSQGNPVNLNQLMKQPSKKFIPIANGGSVDLISDDDDDETESESEEESENEGVATQERQIARELKLLTTKLKTFREKQAGSLKERRILREQLKKKQKELKEEKRKYKLLQKEVDKMAKLMKEAEEDDECDDEEEIHEEEEEEETESDSESEESEEEEESDEEIPPNAGIEEKRKVLLERTKRHENRLSSLKKGNNLMKANIERLQDDVNKQREMSLTLQEDLNNILADLG